MLVGSLVIIVKKLISRQIVKRIPKSMKSMNEKTVIQIAAMVQEN